MINLSVRIKGRSNCNKNDNRHGWFSGNVSKVMLYVLPAKSSHFHAGLIIVHYFEIIYYEIYFIINSLLIFNFMGRNF